MTKLKGKDLIKHIVHNGTPEEKRELYGFDSNTPWEKILKKFKIYARANYPRYFQSKAAPFHDGMIRLMIKSYYGDNEMNGGFRGCAKTSLAKLFVAFVILNDKDSFRKYLKILTKDLKNSKQFVTDVYNLMIEVKGIYGNVFDKEDDVKSETTMAVFKVPSKNLKLAAGTVGQTQRGHVQDAYRPDWLIFDDCEDRDSIASMVITQGIIGKCQEAIDGLSRGGSSFVLCNYISDQGVIQWFKNKPSFSFMNTPIEDEQGNPTWPAAYTKEDIQKIRLDADDFAGEYMGDPSSKENKFFDLDRIERDMKACTDPIKVEGGVKYWKEYNQTHKYGQGSDHSDGIGKDSNTLAGFDFTTGELVYTFADNTVGPDTAAAMACEVGNAYGGCIYAPEINNKCGGVAITTIRNAEYPNIYQRVKRDKSKVIVETKLGWETTDKTKRILFMNFRKAYNKGLIKIYDIEVLKEMKAYMNNDLEQKTTGLITRHFDLLMGVCLAFATKEQSTVAEADDYDDAFDEYLNSTDDNWL